MPIDLPPVVVDGDTFRLGPERVRILNIDAPEMPIHAKCDAEAALALLAKAGLEEALKAPGAYIEITRHGRDRYGRTLALVTVRGSDVGQTLIAAHLAHAWEGSRHDWCGLKDNSHDHSANYH